MGALDELNEAVKTVIELVNKVNDETNEEIWNRSPLIIHQRFCAELVAIAKKNKNKETQEFVDMIRAINILEELYPKLKR